MYQSPTLGLLPALQVGDYSTTHAHDVGRRRAKVVVPRSRCSPHEIINAVVLQQVKIDEHAQLSCVAKGRHAVDGFGNPLPALPTKFVA